MSSSMRLRALWENWNRRELDVIAMREKFFASGARLGINFLALQSEKNDKNEASCLRISCR